MSNTAIHAPHALVAASYIQWSMARDADLSVFNETTVADRGTQLVPDFRILEE